MESLGAGGAERVLVNLVNQLDRTRFSPAILTLFEKGVNARACGGRQTDFPRFTKNPRYENRSETAAEESSV